MKSLHEQRGVGALGWILILLIISIAATLTIRITPHLLTFNTVQSTIDGLDRETLRAPKSKILATIDTRFKINSIYDLKARDILNVNKDTERVTFAIDYRVDEPLFSLGFYTLGVYLHFVREIARPLE